MKTYTQVTTVYDVSQKSKNVQKGLFPVHKITQNKELKSLIESGQAMGSLNPRWSTPLQTSKKNT